MKTLLGLQEIGIGSSLGDAHTVHAGYSGNDFADGYGGHIVRYEYSFGDLAVALSANLSDGSPNDAIHYLTREDLTDFSGDVVPGMSQRDDILAVGAKYSASFATMELGIGIGYAIGDWIFAVNYGHYTENQPDTTNDPEQRGFAVVANYDLGGGAELQLGYSKSTCKARYWDGISQDPQFDGYVPRQGGAVYHGACNHNDENSALSLGVAMSF